MVYQLCPISPGNYVCCHRGEPVEIWLCTNNVLVDKKGRACAGQFRKYKLSHKE